MNAAIVSPTEERQVRGFIDEMVPLSMLPKIIAMASARMSQYIETISLPAMKRLDASATVPA